MIFTLPRDPVNHTPGITDRLGRQLHEIGYDMTAMYYHADNKHHPSIVVRFYDSGYLNHVLKPWTFLVPASPDPRVRDHHGVEIVNALRASSMKRTDGEVEFVIPLRPDDEVYLSDVYAVS